MFYIFKMWYMGLNINKLIKYIIFKIKKNVLNFKSLLSFLKN
jgi:hypothetical protein